MSFTPSGLPVDGAPLVWGATYGGWGWINQPLSNYILSVGNGAFGTLKSLRSQGLLVQPTRITPGLISNITVSAPQGATGGYTLDAGNNLTKFAWSGCTKASAAAPVAHGNAGYTGLNAADSGDVRYAGVVDCIVQSASYQIAFCDYSGGANFFQVWIDDHLVQDATRVMTNGNTYYYTITLPSSRPHHLRLRFANLGFVGINRAATDSVWAPTGPLYGAKAVLLGDSFVAGLYDPNLRHFGFDLCDLLGWECVPAGEPGTGYVNAGGAGQATYPARISTYVAPESPDVVVVLGSVNDFADTPASIQSACSTMLANLASALPQVPVFVFGIEWYFGADNTTFDAIDSALQAACQASTNGYFFSTKGWVTGSGMEKVQPPSLYMYTGGTGGTFTAGPYYWVVTATGSAGETTVSNEIGDTLAAGATRTMRWVSNGSGEVNAKIYRGTAAGAENVLVATVPFGNGTYTDTGAAGTAATPPASNTTTGPVGDGTADVLVTNANTHPTSAGHRNLAFRMAQAIASKYPTVPQQAGN